MAKNALTKRSASCLISLLLGCVSPLVAQTTYTKSNNSTALDQASSWTPAGVPVSADTILWNGTYTNGSVGIGAGLSVTKLSLTNPSIAIAVNSGTGSVTIGSGGIDLSASSQNLTLAAPVILGTSQTWTAATGRTLLVTGSITSTSGFSLSINSGTNAGNVILSPAAGQSVSLTGANNAAFFLQVRSGGLLVLGGDGVSAPTTASSNTIVNASTGSTYGAWTITGGGSVQVNSGTWTLGDLGKNQGADYFSGSLAVTGGTLSVKGMRYLGGGAISVSGGTLNVTNTGSIYSNGGRFSLGAVGSGGAKLDISGGLMDLAQANGGNSIGSGINTLVTHTGGTLQNGVTLGGVTNGGTVTTFTIGAGGTVSNDLSAYTLSGNAVLISAGAVQGLALTTGTNDVSNFNFNGGTLAVGAFTTTNLGYSSATGVAGGSPNANPVANGVGKGTLYNNGGTVAPGGLGTAGKTTITGNYTVNSGALAIDLAGTTQASAFRTGSHDFLSVSGTATLAGNLIVNLFNSYTPLATDTFTVLTAGTLAGAFDNAPFGSRLATSNSAGSFLVSKNVNSVTLSQYKALAVPTITTQPASTSVVIGAAVTLTVAASSDVTPTYQWRKNGVPINGATGTSLVFAAVSSSDAGNYDVLVSNPAGSVTSATATLSVGLFGSDVLGDRPITYNYTGVRPVLPTPASGVHPRVYFNAEELPEIRNRLNNTAVGQEAFKMVKLYTDLLRRGRTLAYDSQPASFKTMPDGTARINNVGLYDRSTVYNELVAGNTTTLVSMINAADGTGLFTLSGEMSLEAFECLVNEGQPGVATRSANLAAALNTWATYVLTLTDFPGAPGATLDNKLANQYKFGGHLNALTYDMVYNAMTQPQRDNVRKVLAQMMGGFFAGSYSDTEYTDVGVPPESSAGNHVAINTFKLLTACALEGEVTTADAGYSAADLSGWFTRAMGSFHKFFTYGWYSDGAPLEGQGKNYLFGAHLIPLAKRGYDFFGHPHVQAYSEYWLPAVTQPFGYSFVKYDLLGGSGSDPEKGRMYIEALDYIALKWRFPTDNNADFAWRNFVLTQYKDGGGNYQTFLDLRDSKFGLRSVYSNQLLPAAIFASDIGSSATWTQQNTDAQGSLDYLDRQGGTLISRSGFDTDATALLFHVRQDMGGHTFADRNTFTLSALGRLFINYNSGSTNSGLQAGNLQSIVEVDGFTMKITPIDGSKMRIPAKLAAWSPRGGQATFATGDATYAYSQEWRWNNYTTGPVVITSGYAAENNNHNNFRRSDNKIAESFASTPFVSFPHWEKPATFEGIQAKPYNAMRQVYRTIGLVRGVKPYALCVDDVRKDDATHTYKWYASIAEDLTPLTGAALPAGCDPATDVVLQEPASTGTRNLLVRILRANGTPALGVNALPGGSALAYTETLSNTTTNENWNHLVIERSGTVAPDFRVLLFPFRAGDALPTTTWSADNLTLTVAVSGQTDTFIFAPRTALVGGQSVTMNEFTLTRGGSTLVDYRNQIEPMATRSPAAVLDTPPAAPTGLTATALSESQVQLAWADHATSETAYLVERARSGTDNWTPLASTLPPNTATFTDSTASATTAYDYRIRCAANAGLSDFANVTITTPAGIGDGIPGWWRYQYFGNGLAIIPGVSGLNSNPDSDALNNLAEYAFGGNPSVSDNTAPIVIQNPQGFLQITFNRLRPDLTYLVQGSNDLATWANLATNPGLLDQPVTFTDTVSGTRRFLRIRVTSP